MSGSVKNRIGQWLGACSDDTILRGLYGVLLAAAVTVVALDYRELAGATAAPGTMPRIAEPFASPFPATEAFPARRDGDRRSSPLRKPEGDLAAPMTFELVGDGRLLATGTIAPGTAKAFAAEIEKRGSYVKTVVLHSPGGSVQDALAIGRLIREKKFDTEVGARGYCASSCPLVFAGGIERRVGEKAVVGVHRISALTRDGMAAPDGDHAQRISADCQRYLGEMGVDFAVWLHAMETPWDELYAFKTSELLSLKLATQAGTRSASALSR